MSILLRVFLIIISLTFFVYISLMVRRNKLLLKYSLLWLVLSILGILLALVPEAAIWVSEQLGFASPANFVYVVIIVVLLVICFTYSMALSQEAAMAKELVQEVSLLKAKDSGGAAIIDSEDDPNDCR